MSAFEEKIAKLKELGIDTPQGILSLIESGVGERGLDTAAERDYIEGILAQIPKAFGVSQEAAKVIKDKFDWSFDVDGKTNDYTFTGDAMPDEVAVQNMRNAHNITADQTGRRVSTPAERDFIMKQQAFEAELIKLSSADLSSVLELFQGLSPQEKDTYMNHVLENGFNYGTINETPLRQQGFQQYNTGTGNLQNLGFGY